MRKIFLLLLLVIISACNLVGGDTQDDAPVCVDGIKNGSETDIDCGGTCRKCEIGKACSGESDCSTGICTATICVDISEPTPTCDDDVVNQNETDFDCGGICQDCELGKRCKKDADCTSSNCLEGVCEVIVSPQCENGLLDGNEIEVDCGGECAPCASGACQTSSDCTATESCVAGMCLSWQQSTHNQRVRISVDNTGELGLPQNTIGAVFPTGATNIDPASLIVFTDEGEQRPVFVETWTIDQKFFWFNATLNGDAITEFWLYYSETETLEPSLIENVFPNRIGVWPMTDNRDVIGERDLEGSLVSSLGINGAGLAYDGASYSTIGDSEGLDLEMGSMFSISIWGRIDPASGSQALLFRPLGVSSANEIWMGWEDGLSPSRWSCWMIDSVGRNVVMRDEMAIVGADDWVQLVVTYDGTRAISYVNGIEYNRQDFIRGIGTTALREFVLGVKTYEGTYIAFLDGALDDLQIYSKILSPNEISFSVKNRGGALVSFSRFETTTP